MKPTHNCENHILLPLSIHSHCHRKGNKNTVRTVMHGMDSSRWQFNDSLSLSLFSSCYILHLLQLNCHFYCKQTTYLSFYQTNVEISHSKHNFPFCERMFDLESQINFVSLRQMYTRRRELGARKRKKTYIHLSGFVEIKIYLKPLRNVYKRNNHRHFSLVLMLLFCVENGTKIQFCGSFQGFSICKGVMVSLNAITSTI